MKRKLYILSLFCILSLTFFSNMALAADFPIPTSDHAAMEQLFKNINKDDTNKITVNLKADAPTNVENTLISYADQKVTFNTDTFKYATDKSRREALSKFIKGLQNSDVSLQTQQELVAWMQESDSDVSRMLVPMVIDSTSADLYKASKVLSPILPTVRVIIGVGVFIVAIFLIISTVMDLVFIGLPIARESMESWRERGKSRIFLVSSDAVATVREVESNLDGGGYRNAVLLYFRRRAVTYIVLSVCLLYLIVGELGGFIDWILRLGSGIVPGS